MQHLQKDSNSMTVGTQATNPIATNTDALTLEGSHAGDTRGQAAHPTPLAGNDTPVRGETESQGA